jgi:hypothetical protein
MKMSIEWVSVNDKHGKYNVFVSYDDTTVLSMYHIINLCEANKILADFLSAYLKGELSKPNFNNTTKGN